LYFSYSNFFFQSNTSKILYFFKLKKINFKYTYLLLIFYNRLLGKSINFKYTFGFSSFACYKSIWEKKYIKKTFRTLLLFFFYFLNINFFFYGVNFYNLSFFYNFKIYLKNNYNYNYFFKKLLDQKFLYIFIFNFKRIFLVKFFKIFVILIFFKISNLFFNNFTKFSLINGFAKIYDIRLVNSLELLTFNSLLV